MANRKRLAVLREGVWARVCSHLIPLLVVCGVSCHGERATETVDRVGLRFDGVYCAEGERAHSYLRFYLDGVLVTWSSDTPEQVVRWFDRSHLYPNPYTLDGQRLAFSTLSPVYITDYEGEIRGDTLHMMASGQGTTLGDTHLGRSHRTATYVFVPLHGKPGPPPPLKAEEPNPPDRSTGVRIPLLRWRSGRTAMLHDIYLGTSPDLGAKDQVGAQQPICMFYYPPGLVRGTTYYWRVDEVEVYGTIHTGDVWSFTAE